MFKLCLQIVHVPEVDVMVFDGRSGANENIWETHVFRKNFPKRKKKKKQQTCHIQAKESVQQTLRCVTKSFHFVPHLSVDKAKINLHIGIFKVRVFRTFCPGNKANKTKCSLKRRMFDPVHLLAD